MDESKEARNRRIDAETNLKAIEDKVKEVGAKRNLGGYQGDLDRAREEFRATH